MSFKEIIETTKNKINIINDGSFSLETESSANGIKLKSPTLADAENLILTGEHDKACEMYKHLLEENEEDVYIRCLYGNCLSILGDVEGAFEQYDIAESLNPKEVTVYLTRCNTLMKLERYSEAFHCLNNVKEEFINNGKFLLAYGMVTAEIRMYDEALEAYKTVVSVARPSLKSSIYYKMAEIYAKQDEIEEAISYCKLSLELEPNDFETLLLLGILYYSLGELFDAIGIYKRAEYLGLKTPRLYELMADAYYRKEKKEAIRYYKMTLEICQEEEKIKLLEKMAKCYIDAGNAEDSERVAKEILAIDENNAEAFFVLSRLCIADADHENAIKYLNKCAGIYKYKAFAHWGLGNVYAMLGNDELVKENYNIALEYDYKDTTLLSDYINYLIDRKDWECAEPIHRRCVREKGIDEMSATAYGFMIHLNLAKENVYSYNFRKAGEYYEEIIKNSSFKLAMQKEVEEYERLKNSIE